MTNRQSQTRREAGAPACHSGWEANRFRNGAVGESHACVPKRDRACGSAYAPKRLLPLEALRRAGTDLLNKETAGLPKLQGN